MASGTLFGLGLSQQFDANGDPLSGCLLYLYLANSSTPVIAYKNIALTAGQELPNPIVADANGRIPAFWLDTANNYRARLTNSVGIVQFDEQNIQPIGISGGGGGGGDTTDPNSVASTGDVKWRPVSSTLAGWVRINGRTIGSVTSGASERANADCQALFEFIWNNFSDAQCPVLTGRGASSIADWNANKQITLVDLRGRSPFGLDDMGNAAAGRLAGALFNGGAIATTPGGSGGEGSHVITQAELPNVTLATTIAAGQGSHAHNLHANGSTLTIGAGQIGATAANPMVAGGSSNLGATDPATLPQLTGTTPLGGAGTAHNNTPPFMLGTWFWRL